MQLSCDLVVMDVPRDWFLHALSNGGAIFVMQYGDDNDELVEGEGKEETVNLSASAVSLSLRRDHLLLLITSNQIFKFMHPKKGEDVPSACN
jgi:hypothetical protein